MTDDPNANRPHAPADLPETTPEPPTALDTDEHVPVAPPADSPPPAAGDTTPAPVVNAGQAAPFGPGRCPRCGSSDLGMGKLFTYSSTFRPAFYKPSRLGLFRLKNMLRPLRAMAEVEALACRRCGMLIFQVDTDRLAHIERRSGDISKKK